MQLSSALIILSAMDMEVVMMLGWDVIVTMTGIVYLTVQVTYQVQYINQY